ncbi:MAG: hypothetical protein EXS39_03465 [Opitutaceae bacterium]|nr:hypothetical protein [Opitutaceae bacterium]
MTNQEARFILGAYRPGGHDAGEALFGDALQQARQDPALGAWFAREQAHATTMAAKLRELAPPPALRAAILAGARMSATPQRSWWMRPAGLAMAAVVAGLLAAVAILWPQRGSAQAAQLAAFAVNDTAHSRHGGHGEPAGALQALLLQPSTRLGGELPVDFAALRTTGCRTLSFAGRDLIEVCFARGGGEFHLYAVRRADFPRLPAEGRAEFGEREGMSFASWADATHHYVVVSAAGLETLKGLL